jgi:hypothetical protein
MSRLLIIGLFFLALIPRLAPMNYLSFDEGNYWVYRSENFLQGLQTGDLAATAQSFHPGVGTMWMGAAGILVNDVINGDDHQVEDNLAYRVAIRRVMAVVNALCVVIGYFLLTRLFKDQRIALLAAIFWATEPMLVGHSSILHVDGLSTSMMVLSFLTGLIAFKLDHQPYKYSLRDQVRWQWWVASAILGGVATLTKFTTLSVIGILFLAALMINFKHFRVKHIHIQAMPFFVWVGIAGVTVFALFPAMWGHMDVVLDRLNYGVELAFEGHRNFFLGEPTIAPGPFYFFVTIAYQVTPWVLLGVVISIITIRQLTKQQDSALLFALALFCIAFYGIMASQPKQLDRYMLPIYPILCVFAALGIWTLFDRLSQSIKPSRIWGTLLVVAVINLIWVYPYYFAYYNPLLGSAPVAQEIILLSTGGAGLEKAITYIEAEEGDNCDVRVLGKPETLLRQYPTCYTFLDANNWREEIDDSDYLILSIRYIQREYFPELQRQLDTITPTATFSFQGVNLVYLYDAEQLNLIRVNDAQDDAP